MFGIITTIRQHRSIVAHMLGDGGGAHMHQRDASVLRR